MSTTTIRLPDDLKKRALKLAQEVGTTMHKFIVQAIAEKTDQEEKRREFFHEADERYDEILKTGKTIAWDDMRSYLKSKAKGKSAVARPTAKKRAR